jgi:hypothetical protein
MEPRFTPYHDLGNSNQNKTKQNKTKQNKTKQNKTHCLDWGVSEDEEYVIKWLSRGIESTDDCMLHSILL